MHVAQTWFPPLLGGLFHFGTVLQNPLIMIKLLLCMCRACIYVFASSCMASMDVKQSPIEVEIRCVILEEEETPIEEEVYKDYDLSSPYLY